MGKSGKEYNSNKDKSTLPLVSSPENFNCFIHPTAIVDEGASIGGNTKIWHFCHVMAKATIGKNCVLGQNVFIANDVIIGDTVKIQNNVSVYTGVICEESVFIGPSVVFTNVVNPRSAINRKDQFKPTLVKTGATIGANATIVCGHTIGRYAFVGAGSVVTKDVKDFELVVGNPARVVGWMSENGCKLHFDQNGKATCDESGEVYLLEGGKVKKLNG